MAVTAALFPDTPLFSWVILPGLIFLARITDVSVGTVRLILVARGFKYLAPIAGFFEVLIWILVIGQIMQNLTNPVCYIAYAGGFATGNFVGLWIAEKLSLGMVLIRVITPKPAGDLLEGLGADNMGSPPSTDRAPTGRSRSSSRSCPGGRPTRWSSWSRPSSHAFLLHRGGRLGGARGVSEAGTGRRIGVSGVAQALPQRQVGTRGWSRRFAAYTIPTLERQRRPD
jgi:hypothetical protein